MSAPPIPYTRQANFTNFATEQFPTTGQDLEAEFNKLAQSVGSTQSRLAEIQRDDGLLANLSVHPDSLSHAVRSLLAAEAGVPRGNWAPGVIYQPKDVVMHGGASYLAATEHTAGADFDADLAAGKWLLLSFSNDGGTLRVDLASPTPGNGASLVQYDADETVKDRLDALGSGGGAALVGFQQAGSGAVERTVQDKLRERVSVKDFGAIGDGNPHPLSERFATLAEARAVYPHAVALTDQIDWCAFVAARNALATGTEYQGGEILVPRGRYKLNRKVQFDDVLSVTNYYVRGDGAVNTELDFSLAADGEDGLVFEGGSLVGVEGLMITGAPGRGIVLNSTKTAFVSMARLKDVRVQFCGGDGIYSLQSYLITIDGIFSTTNGGMGVNFAGNHTSIITQRMYAANNASIGIRINGAVYIDVNGQSDNNLKGWRLSNIRGGVLRAPGTEANKREGIEIISDNASTSGIYPEYTNVQGLVIIGACQIRNNTDGPLGTYANIAISTGDGRPIEVTLIGCVDNVVPGDPSVALNGASGKITVSVIDCAFNGAVVKFNNVELRNLSNTGRYALLERASGAVSIPNNTVTKMTWDGFAAGENSLGATFAGDAIVIPEGVNSVEVSACVTWAGAAGGHRYIAIQKNGTGFKGMPQLRVPAPGALSCPMTVASSKPIHVVAGDTISLIVLHDQGSALNIEGLTGNGNWLCVKAVS